MYQHDKYTLKDIINLMLYPIRYICNVSHGRMGKKGYSLKLLGGLELNP